MCLGGFFHLSQFLRKKFKLNLNIEYSSTEYGVWSYRVFLYVYPPLYFAWLANWKYTGINWRCCHCRFFWIGKPGTMRQTPIRGSGHWTSTCWSFAHQAELSTTLLHCWAHCQFSGSCMYFWRPPQGPLVVHVLVVEEKHDLEKSRMNICSMNERTDHGLVYQWV